MSTVVSAVPLTENASQVLFVHPIQNGNPVLNYIKNVRWKFSNEIVPDYVMQSTCALFLSIRYHFRYPKHILRRIDEVGRNFRLRILLVLVDDEENLAALTDLNKIAFATNFTLLLAWSNQECARYLETFKNYESKSSVSIQSRDETEFLPKLQKVLGNIRSINKTNVTTLMDVFGDFESVCQTTELQLVMCPGLGEKKVKRLLQVLQEPFESRKQAKFDLSSSMQNLDDSTTIEDPSKKYEIHNWHNSNEDVANALRHNNVLDEPVDAEVMQTSVSSTSKPPVSNSSTGAENSIDLELVIDSEVFGFDDDD